MYFTKHIETLARVLVLSLVLLWPLSDTLAVSQAASVVNLPNQRAAPPRTGPLRATVLPLRRSLHEDSSFRVDTTKYAEAVAVKEAAQVELIYADAGGVPTPKTSFRRDLDLKRFQQVLYQDGVLQEGWYYNVTTKEGMNEYRSLIAYYPAGRVLSSDDVARALSAYGDDEATYGDLLERNQRLETLTSGVQVVMSSWVGVAVLVAIGAFVGAAALSRVFNLVIAGIQGVRTGFQLRAALGGTYELVETAVHRPPTTPIDMRATIEKVDGVPNNECSLSSRRRDLYPGVPPIANVIRLSCPSAMGINLLLLSVGMASL